MQLSASPASFGKALAIKYNSARLGKHCTLICTGCRLHCAPGAMLRGTQGRNGESKVENNVYRVIDLILICICIDIYISISLCPCVCRFIINFCSAAQFRICSKQQVQKHPVLPKRVETGTRKLISSSQGFGSCTKACALPLSHWPNPLADRCHLTIPIECYRWESQIPIFVFVGTTSFSSRIIWCLMDPGGIFLLSLFGCSYHGLWPAGCSPTNTVTGAVVLNPIGNRFVPFLSHICSFSLNFCLSNLILKGKLDKQRLLVDIVDIFDCHDVDLNSGHTRVGRRCSSEKSSSMLANFSVVQQCSADLCDSRSAFVASKRTSTVCPCEEYKKNVALC